MSTPEPQAPTRKPRRWPWVLAVIVALFVGIGIGQATGDNDNATAAETASPSTGSEPNLEPVVEDEPAPEPEPEPEPEPDAYEPTVDDFELDVKTLEKQCFGSAGCNVTFRIEVAYGGEPLDPDTTYEVIYEIEGGDDPKINTLTITGDSYRVDETERIGTPSSDSELVAIVTSVSEY
ncbi:hypothetical protein G1H11_14035 [Phytoactinopolyspora alkaliphila]|uniref:Uncharacterized protein n=1 Tax=Phytoactinopolyspora alkaliphila TaxID=1783498 RepID=A0A6N9YNA6_9ACTN|nr:hypothetical protein [Phytoactinopolyspora alkaliphila]NED96425.1 hypothetical protein [Phytoactinopolyspora alkaliphila]